MQPENLDWFREQRDRVRGRVLEVGSFQVDGQQSMAPRRHLPPHVSEFVGLDLRSGEGVDVVSDAKSIPFPENWFETVLTLDTLEHCDWPRDVFREMARVLRPSGYLLVCVPFRFGIHDHPSDYWRFTPACLGLLASDSKLEVVDLSPPHRASEDPGIVRLVARKP